MFTDKDVALGIVRRNDRVLFVERVKPEGDLLWTFPGGTYKAKKDNNLIHTLRREVEEETNIDCVALKLLGERKRGPVHIHYYLCAEFKKKDIIIAADEAKQADWYLPQEIFELATSAFHPPVEQYLQKMIAEQANQRISR